MLWVDEGQARHTAHRNQTDDPDNTTDIENQIVYSFNGRHQITKSEQSHEGAVSGSSPNVRYAYDDSEVSGVYDDVMRPFNIICPDGRTLFYDYGTSNGLEDRQQWVKQLRETDGSGTIWAEYSHTGTGREMITDYPQPDLKQDLFGGTSSTYAGLDRFGRTIDHRWYDYSSGTIDRARYNYGYDEASNRIWKEDPVADANSVDLDDLSTFDGLHRLTAIDRGELNGTQTAISTLEFAQDFDLDQLNNWSNFTEDSDGNGTDDLDQDRSHNDANEITDIDASSTHVAHDAAGNMTKVPKPDNWSAHYDLTWDAWDRLVTVEDGANTVAEYEYDGQHRRIRKDVYAGGTLDHTRHYYLSTDWQVLEERVDTSTDPDRQYTWGERYIDDLVLRTRDTTGNGVLNETTYPLQDANWNITALADINGAIVERFDYDPYGQSTVLDANFTNDANGLSDFDWTIRFTSQRIDATTDTSYFRNRDYHHALATFISRDPLQYIDGLNRYAAYFITAGVDPLGLSCKLFGRKWVSPWDPNADWNLWSNAKNYGMAGAQAATGTFGGAVVGGVGGASVGGVVSGGTPAGLVGGGAAGGFWGGAAGFYESIWADDIPDALGKGAIAGAIPGVTAGFAKGFGGRGGAVGGGLRGKNPRFKSGRVNTEMGGGIKKARKMFEKLTGGMHQKDSNGHLIGNNGVRLRIGKDGRPRLDIPANRKCNRKHETIHFNP